MDTGRRKKWNFSKERQIACNFAIIVIGFGLMVVYTKMEIRREISTMDLQRPERTRQKRQANLGEDEAMLDWAEEEFIAAHLTAARGRNVRYGASQAPLLGHYFRWESSGPDSFATIDIRQERLGTTARIHKAGFYFIYSQIRYNGNGLFPAGHRTIKISNEQERNLMTSLTTQQLASAGNDHEEATQSTDSGYQAGIFYLSTGDKIAVKPIFYQKGAFYTVGEGASFFGLHFLHV